MKPLAGKLKNMKKSFKSLFGLGLLAVAAIVIFSSQPLVVADNLSLDDQTATIRAIEKARPAVVSVMVYDQENTAIVDLLTGKTTTQSERVLKGSGSGFIISSNGWILTNKHVVEAGAGTADTDYIVVLNDKRKFEAIMVGKDPFNDLAVLRILGKDFPYLQLASSDDLPVGATVLAIGNALGRYQNTVTKGIISGLGRSIVASDKKGHAINLDNVIQTDAEINQGNSGGPLINLEGKIIGINVAVDNSGTSIGFALPANDIKPVIDSIIAHGRIIRPWVGVRYIMITPELVEERNLPRNSGALLIKSETGEYAVAPNSPASRADLREGDIIFEVNGQAVDENRSLLSITQRSKPSDKLALKVQRGSQILDKTLVLEEFKQ